MRHPDLSLADRFVSANADLMHLLTGATETQLALITPEEGWSMLLVAHHIALAYSH